MPVTISGTTGIQTPGVANSGTSTAALFSGPLAGNVTGNVTGNASTATLATTIADSAVTTSKLALSAVTANRINLVTSLDTNGYQIMPGGLILQWGQVSSNGSEDTYTATFPIAFPNACLQVIPGVNLNNWSFLVGANFSAQVASTTRTEARLFLQGQNSGGGSGTVFLNYIAIGN